MSGDSPAVILFDVNGNPVGTVIDGVLYRLQVEAKLAPGTDIIGNVGIDGYNTGGLALESTLDLIKAKTDNLDVALSTRAVTGLTDTQLRAMPVPISGTVTSNQGVAGTDPWPVNIQGGTVLVSNMQQLAVETKIDTDNFNLQSSAYSVGVPFANDSLLSVLELRFTTSSSRDIAISLDDGTILFSENANTSLIVEIDFEDYAIDSGTTLTLIISQTGAACLVDITLIAKIGTAALGGNSVLGSSTSHIGSVSIDMSSNTSSGDAFGRLRTSNPQSIFEVTHQYDLAPRLMGLNRQDSGTTIVHLSPCAILSVPAITGRKIIHQSHQYMIYLPGKSHLIRMTGQLNNGESISSMGYGDGYDGIFLENNNFTMQIRFLSSTIANQVIPQNEWNIDALDGYGTSGFTLNLNSAYQLIIDLSWLGVGRVRVGFDIGGNIIYAHQFAFSNEVTTAYMRSGSLPVLWSLESIGSAASMKAICAAVSSECGSDPIGIGYSASRTSSKTTLGVGVKTPLISLRPKLTFNGLANNVHLIWNNIGFLSETADNLLVEIVEGGVLTGASWTSVDVDSHAESDQLATAISGGRVIFNDYVSAQSRGLLSAAGQINFKTLPLTLTANGVQNNVTICVTRILGSANCFASFNWREVH